MITSKHMFTLLNPFKINERETSVFGHYCSKVWRW